MASDERLRLPFLCECGDVGCERCVSATVEEFQKELLFAPGHEPEKDGSVAEVRQLRD
jgi:hypothetical protein